MLSNLVTALVERIINTTLALDKNLITQLNKVEHQRLLVDIRDWQQQLLIVFSAQHLHLYLSDEQHADCMISADIDTLIALKDPSVLTQLIRQDKLDLQGDLNVAQAYSNAFANIDIDWPEHASNYFGDAGAQQLHLVIQKLKTQNTKSLAQLSNTITTLCQDELNVTIHPLELEQFKQQNRQLKSQTAQLEMRINLLFKLNQ